MSKTFLGSIEIITIKLQNFAPFFILEFVFINTWTISKIINRTIAKIFYSKDEYIFENKILFLYNNSCNNII